MIESSHTDAKPFVIIRPATRQHFPNLTELFGSRDLLAFLIRRAIKIRYRQTLLGAGWAVVQPVLTMVMMTIVFRKLIGLPSDGLPYPLFCLAGLVLWSFTTQAVSASASSIIYDVQLIEKVYFPRLLLPIAAVLRGLLDASVSFVFLILVMLAYGIFPSPLALLCIPIGLLAALLAISIGSALAALSVRFRDIGYLIPFGTQLGLFITPIAYPVTLIPEKWRLLFAINPAVGLVETFRWALFGLKTNPFPLFAVSMLSLALITFLGLMIFRRLEHNFADLI
ncbi:MAG TPA: ABC transporter permease [Allosphingosinicella sp.]|nr:ABC transporter permease [Allosphingosinicella sp.]